MYVTDVESIMVTLELALSSKRKRHLIGGTLMSVSLLFAGLAITVMTVKEEMV